MRRFFQAFFMALAMSGVMSLVMTVVKVGWSSLLIHWLPSWGLGFVVSFPLSFFFAAAHRPMAGLVGFEVIFFFFRAGLLPIWFAGRSSIMGAEVDLP